MAHSSGSTRPSFDRELAPGAVDAGVTILGQSLIEGAHTRIATGAHIENSYVRDVCVGPGARIVDSVVMGTRTPDDSHVPGGYASRWAIRREHPPRIGAGAEVLESTLVDTSVGNRTRCQEVYVGQGSVGEDNLLRRVYAVEVHSGAHVTVDGPTEISEAWLGHHTTIDTCGFFEGVFSNDFYVIEFDEASGRLQVPEVLDVPHVSRYGMNTINSTNSGNLLDPPDGVLRSLGPHLGLWQDTLLSHEPMVLGPCCWVAGWTKVIGKSAAVHADAADLLADPLATHLMPFSAAGVDGGSVTGLVVPGERYDAPAPRRRIPGWVFTYAPGAVIAMVRRVVQATGDAALADALPRLALRGARALVHAQARQRGVDLHAAHPRRPKGWTGWLLEADRVLNAHLESGLWDFSQGEPAAWRERKGRWQPVDAGALTRIAADALARQVGEEALIACDMEPLPRTLGATPAELAPTRKDSIVDQRASVSATAFVGPGVQIRGASTVEDGAWLCHAVVDNATIAAGARVLRSAVTHSRVADRAQMVSSRVVDSTVAAGSTVTCARIVRSTLDGVARVSPYALIEESHLGFPCIVGSNIRHARVDATFMSYHMPGQVEGLVVEPTSVVRNGVTVTVPAVPMLGGGLRVLGTSARPARIACSFIGSNAILEGGAYAGFGCFVLGRLTASEALPPFTVSTSPGPQRDQIGMVVHQFASMVISHFINWAYQALGPERAEDVALLVPTMLAEGRDAVAWVREQRRRGDEWDPEAPYARYRSLALYSDTQLEAGARAYAQALDGRWDLHFTDGQLRFTGPGKWRVQSGVARWEPSC